MQLYSAKLEQLRSGAAPAAAELQAELQQLEGQLPVGDIMQFRSLAEAAVEHSSGAGAAGALFTGAVCAIDLTAHLS